MTKWMTSGADRLKSKAARTFGARRGQKAAAAVAASRDPRARDSSAAPSRAVGGGGARGPRRNHGGRHQASAKGSGLGGLKTDGPQKESGVISTRDQGPDANDNCRSQPNARPAQARAPPSRHQRLPSTRRPTATGSMNGLPPNLGGGADPYANLRHAHSQGGHPGQAQGAAGGYDGALGGLAHQDELRQLRDAHARVAEAELAARAMRERALGEQAAQAAQLHGGLGQGLGGGLGQFPGLQGLPGGFQISPGLQDEALRADSIERIVAAQQAALAASGAPLPSNAGIAGLQRELDFQQRQLAEAQFGGGPPGMPGGFGGGLGGLPGQAGGGEPHPELGRLLQLSQLSDEDLIRRAAEVRGAQGNTLAALDQHLLEARALQHQGGGGAPPGATGGVPQWTVADSRDGLPQLPAAAALRATAGGGGSGGQKHAPGLANHQSDPHRPLRYFNNGVEVDMHGHPLPSQPPSAQVPATTGAQAAPLVHGIAAPAPPAPPPGDESNMVAKFLTVVVSRVPEVAPAVADLLPDARGDPAILKREFPRVVAATLRELRSLEERFGQSHDERGRELYMRVVNCSRAIEPYKADVGAGVGALPAPSMDPGTAVAPFLPHAAASNAAALGMAGAMLPGMPPGLPSGMVMNQGQRDAFLAMQRVHAAEQQRQEEAAMVQQQYAAALAMRQMQQPPVGAMGETDSDDELPMMAAHNMHKRAAKKASKKKKKNKRRRKRKKKTTEPKVVWRGALDERSGGGMLRLEASAAGCVDNSVAQSAEMEGAAMEMEGTAEKVAEGKSEETKDGATEGKMDEPEGAARGKDPGEYPIVIPWKDRPAKKRRRSDENGLPVLNVGNARTRGSEAEGEGNGVDASALPVLNVGSARKKEREAESDDGGDSGKGGSGSDDDGSEKEDGEGEGKGGPHGALLDRLFGGKKGAQKEAVPKPTSDEEKEGGQATEPSNDEDCEDEKMEESAHSLVSLSGEGSEKEGVAGEPEAGDETAKDSAQAEGRKEDTPEVDAESKEEDAPAPSEETSAPAAGTQMEVDAESKEDAATEPKEDAATEPKEDAQESQQPAALSTIESIKRMLAPKPANGEEEDAPGEEKDGDGEAKEEEGPPSGMDLLQGYSSSSASASENTNEKEAPKPPTEEKEGDGDAKDESRSAAEPSAGDAKEERAETTEKLNDAAGKAEAKKTSLDSTLITDDSDHERKPASQPASRRPSGDDETQPPPKTESQPAVNDESEPVEESNEGDGEGEKKEDEPESRPAADYGDAGLLLGLMGK